MPAPTSPSDAAGARVGSPPLVAGLLTAIVGFASSFAVVLAGLRSVGASADQAASGLLTLSVVMGLITVVLSRRHRMPVSIAWSTPGAALLVSSGAVSGGYAAAVGAFAVAGALTVLAGLWRPLARLVAAIPVPIASAMLAGFLLPICVKPALACVEVPAQAIPVVAVWALLTWLARRWAVPGALVAASIAVALDPVRGARSVEFALPPLTFTTPSLSVAAIVSIALPLFVVTMASQNVPGFAVLRTFGYAPPVRPILVSSGLASVAVAPLGGHQVNLAAITAALVVGPDAGPDPTRRWIAGVSSGVGYAVLGLGAGLATTLVAAAPHVLVEGVAGLALLGALGGSLAAAMEDASEREAALVTLVVAASGVTAFGVGGAFWGLVAGLGMRVLLSHRAAPAVGRSDR